MVYKIVCCFIGNNFFNKLFVLLVQNNDLFKTKNVQVLYNQKGMTYSLEKRHTKSFILILLKTKFMFSKIFYKNFIEPNKKFAITLQLETYDVLFIIMVKKIVYSCFIENNFCV